MVDTQSTDACMGKPHRCGWKVWWGIVSLGLCIYFKSKIYKLPSAVGCSRLDYLPRENMAVKNSCVCVLHCIRLTLRSLAGWKNRVRNTQRWGQLSHSREVASDIASPPPFAPRAQQKRDSSDWAGTYTFTFCTATEKNRHGACASYVTLWPAEDKVNVIFYAHVTLPAGGTSVYYIMYYDKNYWPLISDYEFGSLLQNSY